MYCSKCGVKLSENSRFCQVCGTPIRTDSINPVPQTEASTPLFVAQTTFSPDVVKAQTALTPSAKKSGKKPVLVVLLVIVALIILGGGAFLAKTFLLKSGADTEYKTEQNLLVFSDQLETQIFSGGKKSVTINGLCNEYTYSMDGKQVALKMDADDYGYADLWYCNKDKTDNVDNKVYSFVFSADGNKIMYLKDCDYYNYVGDLYIYDIQSEKSKLVAKKAHTDYAISPDGKSMAYTSDIKTNSSGLIESFTGYVVVNGGEAIALDKNQFAFALADDGKYIYYAQTDDEDSSKTILYINNGKTDKKIGSFDPLCPIYLNIDNSEIMFVKSGATYICANGGDKQKVSDLPLCSIITPAHTQYLASASYSVDATVIGVSSLAKQIVASGDSYNGGTTLTYLQSDGKTVDLYDFKDYYYMYDMSLMPNGKSLYYLNDTGKIVCYDDYRDTGKSPRKIRGDKDITYFVVMPDQSAIYYVDTENTLWVQRGEKDPEEIASNVGTYSIRVSYDGKGVYYISDYKTAENGDGYVGNGTLYYVENTSSNDSKMIVDKAYRVEVSQYGTTYFLYDHIAEDTNSYIGAAFISQNDKDFESIMYDVVIG